MNGLVVFVAGVLVGTAIQAAWSIRVIWQWFTSDQIETLRQLQRGLTADGRSLKDVMADLQRIDGQV